MYEIFQGLLEKYYPHLEAILAGSLLVAISLQFVMRVLGELMTRLSVRIGKKWVGTLGSRLSRISWFLGAYLGKIGYGVPVLVEKYGSMPDTSTKRDEKGRFVARRRR